MDLSPAHLGQHGTIQPRREPREHPMTAVGVTQQPPKRCLEATEAEVLGVCHQRVGKEDDGRSARFSELPRGAPGSSPG